LPHRYRDGGAPMPRSIRGGIVLYLVGWWRAARYVLAASLSDPRVYGLISSILRSLPHAGPLAWPRFAVPWLGGHVAFCRALSRLCFIIVGALSARSTAA